MADGHRLEFLDSHLGVDVYPPDAAFHEDHAQLDQVPAEDVRVRDQHAASIRVRPANYVK